MMIGIFVCKKVAVVIAVWMSRTFVKSDPIGNKPLLRIKFSDQFWQLVVHVVRYLPQYQCQRY